MVNPWTIVKLARAAWRLVKDPNRLDEVITIADDIATPATVAAMRDAIEKAPGGARALAERPRLRLDLAALRALPAGTFGREVARFLDDRGLDPDALPHRAAPDETSWILAHLYETHDVWHVATGFDTDVPGETGLQAFYLAQLPARLAAILMSILFLNLFLYRFEEKDARMNAIVRGWQLGKRAEFFVGKRWDQLWHVPLGELRAQLGTA
jgi:ubiquinone biosynthesis protein COQ4